MPKIEELHKVFREHFKHLKDMRYQLTPQAKYAIDFDEKEINDLFSAFQAEQEAKWQKLRNGVALFKVDLTSRFNALETTEINNPRFLLRQFWFRQQKNTLSELIERVNQLEKVFDDPATTEKTPLRRQNNE